MRSIPRSKEMCRRRAQLSGWLRLGSARRHGLLQRHGLLPIYFLTLALLTGCGGEEPSETGPTDVLTSYVALAGLSATTHEQLKNELARLEAERATIVDLDEKFRPKESRQDLNALAKGTLEAQELVDRMLNQLKSFRPSEFDYDDRTLLTQAQLVASRHEMAGRTLASLVAEQDAEFWIDFEMGLSADLSFVERAEAGFYWSAIQLATAIDEDKLREAIERLRTMLDFAHKLSAVPAIVPRLKGAELRSECGHALKAILGHPNCGRRQQLDLRAAMLAELGRWIDEQVTWQGDRALGLHTYEMIRDGQYLSLLSEEETAQLKAEKMHYATARLVAENVDSDEWFYLKTMRLLCNSTSQPYSERGAMIATVEKELTELSRSEDYPLVAAEMLLPNWVLAQKQIAEDRARIEAWALVLSLSTGERLPSSTQNPASGAPYGPVEEDGLIRLSNWSAANEEAEPSARVTKDLALIENSTS